MATVKQKLVFKEVVKGSTISSAMVKAGYAKSTSKRTNKVTATDGWKELMDTHLSESSLAQAHRDLLQQKRIDYFVFPKSMEDDEIVEHVASVGIVVITVRQSDKGKMAFYSIDDANARKGALDMAYKLKGLYAPEKNLNVNVDVEATETIKELAEEVNRLYRGSDLTGNGAKTVLVDSKVQSKK